MALDFAQVVVENQSMVFSIAVRFLRDRELAAELAQDAFVQLHRQLNQLESGPHVTSWLRRAICHRCIDEIRKRKLRLPVAIETIREPAASDSFPDVMLHERLRRFIATLPEAARMIVILRYQEDLDPADIAKLLDMPLQTVKSHLYRSLNTLREKFEKREVAK